MGVFINLLVYTISFGILIFMVILGIKKLGKHGIQHSTLQDEAAKRFHNDQHQQRLVNDPYLNQGVDAVVDRHYHGLDQHHSGNDQNNGSGGFNNGF